MLISEASLQELLHQWLCLSWVQRPHSTYRSVVAHPALVESVCVVGDADEILQWIKLLHRNRVVVKERFFFVACGVVVVKMLASEFFRHRKGIGSCMVFTKRS